MLRTSVALIAHLVVSKFCDGDTDKPACGLIVTKELTHRLQYAVLTIPKTVQPRRDEVSAS